MTRKPGLIRIRRWDGTRLLPVGFRPEIARSTALGRGAGYEILQARFLEADLQHPLKIEPFLIERRSESQGGHDRLGSREGMITLIAYTNGVEGIPDVPKEDLVTSGTELRFGGGKKRKVDIETVEAGRGLLLFAATVHYRSQKEIAELRNRRRSFLQFTDYQPVGENHESR